VGAAEWGELSAAFPDNSKTLFNEVLAEAGTGSGDECCLAFQAQTHECLSDGLGGQGGAEGQQPARMEQIDNSAIP